MAENYLGDDTDATPEFLAKKGYPPLNDQAGWALAYIESYGGIDGDHHKTWVLDQVARILNGTPVIAKVARWGPSDDYPDGFEELRFTTQEPPSPSYTLWVDQSLGAETCSCWSTLVSPPNQPDEPRTWCPDCQAECAPEDRGREYTHDVGIPP